MCPTYPPIGTEEGGILGTEEGGALGYEEVILPGGEPQLNPQVLTVGAILTHDGKPLGTVEAGSPLSMQNGVPIIRVGDPATCSEHGATTVASGSPLASDLGQPIARSGDLTACEAILIPAVTPDVWFST